MHSDARSFWQQNRPTTTHPFDTACVAPWVSIEFDPSGWVYSCCTSQMYPLGRIGEDRLRDLWGGPRSQVLRDALRNWDLTVACGPCRWHLEHGRSDPVAAVYDELSPTSLDPAGPQMMLFALSNRCNLGCVMCTPELSSTLRAKAGMAPIASPYDDEFFQDLEPMLGGLKLAKFLGGEPFLAPEHQRVWDLLDQLADPPRLQITTNGTIWTDRVDWILDRFDSDISISVDAATAETYAAIRHGGNFEDLLTNVERFRDRCARKGTELHVSYCLMAQNVRELGGFLEWAEQFDVGASVNLVTDTGLAMYDLPTERLEVIQRDWDVEDRARRGALRTNLPVWETQLTQLATVIAERRAGGVPIPLQARGVEEHEFRPLAQGPAGRAGRSTRRADDVRVAEHRRRLQDWSGDGPVAEIRSTDGIVTSVHADHPRLGLSGRSLLDRSIDTLPDVMSRADRRPVWLIERAELDDYVVRTLALAKTRPARGAPGSMIRTIELAVHGGSVLLVAEDRIYEALEAVPVAIRGLDSTT